MLLKISFAVRLCVSLIIRLTSRLTIGQPQAAAYPLLHSLLSAEGGNSFALLERIGSSVRFKDDTLLKQSSNSMQHSDQTEATRSLKRLSRFRIVKQVCMLFHGF